MKACTNPGTTAERNLQVLLLTDLRMAQIERIAATEPETLPVAGSGALRGAAEAGRKQLEVSPVARRALRRSIPFLLHSYCMKEKLGLGKRDPSEPCGLMSPEGVSSGRQAGRQAAMRTCPLGRFTIETAFLEWPGTGGNFSECSGRNQRLCGGGLYQTDKNGITSCMAQDSLTSLKDVVDTSAGERKRDVEEVTIKSQVRLL